MMAIDSLSERENAGAVSPGGLFPGVSSDKSAGATTNTLASFQAELERSPTFASLRSRGLVVEFANENFLVSFVPGSSSIEIGHGFIKLLEHSPNSSDDGQLILEVIGRCVLARYLLDKCVSADSPGRHDFVPAQYEAWFSVRPLLHAIWQAEYDFDGPLPQALLSALLDSRAIEFLGQALTVQNTYSDLLAAVQDGIFGGGSSESEGLRELDAKRFQPPTGKRIVYFRQSSDGFILPIFGAEDFKFISKYNPSEVSLQYKAYRIRTSGLILPANNFESSFSNDDLRYSYNTPLEIRENDHLSKTFGPYLYCLPASLAKILSHPNQFFVTATIEQTDERVHEYSVLINGAPVFNSNRLLGTSGRTGILFRNDLPVVVELGGFQYLVELKGAGSPDGGFPLLAQRSSGHWNLLGGFLQSYGEDEFSSLCENDQRSSPELPSVKPVCLMEVETAELMNDPVVITPVGSLLKLGEYPPKIRDQIRSDLGEKQSMIVRLTPATERLSFLPWSEAFRRGDIQKSKTIRSLGGLSLEERISCYGTMLARLLKPPRRQGHLAAHMENILAGSLSPIWQDYADAIDLYVSRSHYVEPRCMNRRYLTLCVLNHTFYYVARTAKLFYGSFGVSYKEFAALFYRAFAIELFGESALEVEPACKIVEALEPLRLQDKRGITDYLWEEYFALDNFLWCTQNFDLPKTVFAERTQGFLTDHRDVSEELIHDFLLGEIAFVSQAQHIAARRGDAQSCDVLVELEENLAVARECLDLLTRKESLELPLLPYLKKSQASACPRKPKSWSP